MVATDPFGSSRRLIARVTATHLRELGSLRFDRVGSRGMSNPLASYLGSAIKDRAERDYPCVCPSVHAA